MTIALECGRFSLNRPRAEPILLTILVGSGLGAAVLPRLASPPPLVASSPMLTQTAPGTVSLDLALPKVRLANVDPVEFEPHPNNGAASPEPALPVFSAGRPGHSVLLTGEIMHTQSIGIAATGTGGATSEPQAPVMRPVTAADRTDAPSPVAVQTIAAPELASTMVTIAPGEQLPIEGTMQPAAVRAETAPSLEGNGQEWSENGPALDPLEAISVEMSVGQEWVMGMASDLPDLLDEPGAKSVDSDAGEQADAEPAPPLPNPSPTVPTSGPDTKAPATAQLATQIQDARPIQPAVVPPQATAPDRSPPYKADRAAPVGSANAAAMSKQRVPVPASTAKSAAQAQSTAAESARRSSGNGGFSSEVYQFQIPVQINGDKAGSLALRLDRDSIYVKIGDLLALVEPRMDRLTYARLSSSRSVNEYVTLQTVRDSGIDVRYDAANALLKLGPRTY